MLGPKGDRSRETVRQNIGATSFARCLVNNSIPCKCLCSRHTVRQLSLEVVNSNFISVNDVFDLFPVTFYR